MSITWNELKSELEGYIEKSVREAKRAIKPEPPKLEETKESIRIEFTKAAEAFVSTVNRYWSRLKDPQKDWIIIAYNNLKVRAKKTFDKLGSTWEFPVISEIEIKKARIKEEKMNVVEFINLADRVLPKTFDGSSKLKNAFIDGLELLKTHSDKHEETALKLVKTRLSGAIRSYITDDITTVDQVIDIIKTRCLTTSATVIENKLRAFRNRDTDTTVKEITNLAAELRETYIAKGASVQMADSFCTEKVIEALKNNSKSQDTRTALNCCNFTTIEEVVNKFAVLEVQTAEANVFYQGNWYKGNQRGRYHAPSRRFNYNYRGNRRPEFRNREFQKLPRANIRTYESGNPEDPQLTELGEIQEYNQ